MQTLISVFDDRGAARRAVQRLVQAGFSQDDVHLQESAEARPERDPNDRIIGERTMESAEREVAVDRGVLDSLGRFFVSLFGRDRGEKHAGTYGQAVQRGNSVLIVDAKDDHQAETAAVILHDTGAIDVDEHHEGEGNWSRPGVRSIQREEQPSLREVVAQRDAREERAHAADDLTITERDRPK